MTENEQKMINYNVKILYYQDNVIQYQVILYMGNLRKFVIVNDAGNKQSCDKI